MEYSEFTPTSQLRHPRQFLRVGARSLRASVPLARRLFVRDIKARYRQSVLGFVWIVLPALGATSVWVFLNESSILNGGDTRIPYPLYVLIGTVLWQGFIEALTMPGNQLGASTALLTRVNFPPESLLLAGLADVVVNTVVRLVIAVPVLAVYRVWPGWGLLLAPVGVLALVILGFAIGLAVAPFGLLYHDLNRGLSLIAGFWLLITPVAYTLPTENPGRLLAILNPVTQILIVTRDWLSGGPIVPDWSFFVILGLSLVGASVAWVLFRVSIPHLIDRFGS